MSYFKKKRFSMRQVVGMLSGVFLGITVIAYAVTIPNTFTSGTTISANEVNANFTAVKNAIDPLEVSRYYQFGNLNNASVNVTNTWTKLNTTSTSHSFTKNRADSKIEVHVNSRFNSGTFAGGAFGISFEVRIDDSIAATFGNNGSILQSDTADFQSIYAVFEGLSAGDHTISIWARTSPGGSSSTNVYLDSGGWGGKIIVKETGA